MTLFLFFIEFQSESFLAFSKNYDEGRDLKIRTKNFERESRVSNMKEIESYFLWEKKILKLKKERYLAILEFKKFLLQKNFLGNSEIKIPKQSPKSLFA